MMKEKKPHGTEGQKGVVKALTLKTQTGSGCDGWWQITFKELFKAKKLIKKCYDVT